MFGNTAIHVWEDPHDTPMLIDLSLGNAMRFMVIILKNKHRYLFILYVYVLQIFYISVSKLNVQKNYLGFASLLSEFCSYVTGTHYFNT